MKEKAEEHEVYRVQMQKTVESIQADLDNELTLRQQAVRAKSKLEADLADIEVQLGHANHQAEQAIRKGLKLFPKFKILITLMFSPNFNRNSGVITSKLNKIKPNKKTSTRTQGTEQPIRRKIVRSC